MYQAIRSAAYEPDPTHRPWTEPLKVMRMGEELHTELTRLYARTVRQSNHPVRLPVRQLNSLLRAMAPGIAATARGAGTDFQAPWLYGREPVPEQVIASLISTWAVGLGQSQESDEDVGEASRGDEEDELLRTVDLALNQLPAWQTEHVDLTETRLSPGGTAEPAGRLYSLLPESIAFRLAARPYRTRGAELAFRVVSCDKGAELVSWPPQRYEHRKRTWYYSALVTISVHTVPFAERFRVHVSTSIRRWATHVNSRGPHLRGATVLLDAPLTWADGSDTGYRLTGNTIGFDRGRGRIAWRRHSPALLLPDLDIVRSYPDPEDLLAAPEKWINGRHDIAAGIIHSAGLGPHGVGPGLMPKERSEIDAWVEEGMRPMLRRVPDLTRVTRHNTPSLLPRTASPGDGDAREADRALARREALAGTLRGSPLDIEILWQSSETLSELLEALPKLIGLSPVRPAIDGTEHTLRWQAHGLDITIRARPAGSLAAALPEPVDRKRPRAARLAAAVADRCALVEDQVQPPGAARGLAIIEIGSRDRFPVPDSDPKSALRIACARAGRLTQFVNLPEDTAGTLPHRARWTWLDAFRQLGAISPPAHRVGAGIPGDLQYVAIWLVRLTKKGPTRCPGRRIVAVRVRPDDGPGVVHGWDPELAHWVPYPQLLLSLTEDRGPWEKDRYGHGGENQWKAEAERQIKTLLFQLRERPTLLLASAGNLRQCWPGLANGALVKDSLVFGDAAAQRLAVLGPELRLVLMRDANNRDEVPQWYAHDGNGRAGFSRGVWGLPDPANRVFVSTADVPHTATLPKGLMKLVPTTQGRGAPGKSAWNPVYLELTVLGCLPGETPAEPDDAREIADRPAEWATLAHQLRFHDDYPPLARPLPLHLARLAGEYVLPLVPAPSEERETGGRA
ncbi:DUF3962 domain-containing protein [Streptomyces rubiginosohelvolus]|uniref:pPIWI_RE module domain-containing protein n=1 Tax=Streptomyces rubiginosohelvolus TaxID=67362 RepID=UPI0033ACF3BB